MAWGTRHRAGWEDEALITGSLDLHSSLRVSKAASFTLRLREDKSRQKPCQKPSGR